MQRIFFFEIATAIKDRPKLFQIVTLVLFAFSLTMIVVCSLMHLSETDNGGVFEDNSVNRFVDFTSASEKPFVSLEK